MKYLEDLPSWMLSLIHSSYKKEVEEWIDYLFDHITEFCEKDSESLINWSTVDKGGISSLFSGKLSFEQKLWISVQSKINKEELQKFVIDIKDSLLPWLNTDLYQKVQDRKDNTRENIAYEDQRKKLQEGRLEDLDIIG